MNYEELKVIINTETLADVFDILDEELPELKGKDDYEKCRRDFEDDTLSILKSGIRGRLRSIVKKQFKTIDGGYTEPLPGREKEFEELTAFWE